MGFIVGSDEGVKVGICVGSFVGTDDGETSDTLPDNIRLRT